MDNFFILLAKRKPKASELRTHMHRYGFFKSRHGVEKVSHSFSAYPSLIALELISNRN